VIVASDAVRKRMSVDTFLELMGRNVPAAPKVALPVVTFTETVTFHLNGEEIHVMHVPPAHTDGDSVVFFRKAGVVHTGDLFFNGFYPVIDVGVGGSIDGMIAAADRILRVTNDKTKFIPGHGPLATKADKAFRDMLAAVRDAIVPLVAKGMSAADIVKSQADRGARRERWGKGFMKPNVRRRGAPRTLTPFTKRLLFDPGGFSSPRPPTGGIQLAGSRTITQLGAAQEAEPRRVVALRPRPRDTERMPAAGTRRSVLPRTPAEPA
jgi:glyoxylase-like metal-dependent hydrolase (beta-lactamase superfamily II)